MLVGHEEQKAVFIDALRGGRMHHAWLIAGPRGIGKRCFADWAALQLLSGEHGANDVDPAASAARLVESGAHPDHRILAPPEEGRGSAPHPSSLTRFAKSPTFCTATFYRWLAHADRRCTG
jgi:DNA polymerase III subunit delta'